MIATHHITRLIATLVVRIPDSLSLRELIAGYVWGGIIYIQVACPSKISLNQYFEMILVRNMQIRCLYRFVDY
jgi:hypothetical protein